MDAAASYQIVSMDVMRMWGRCGLVVIDLAIHCMWESKARLPSEECAMVVSGSATRYCLEIRKLAGTLNLWKAFDNCLQTIRLVLRLAIDRRSFESRVEDIALSVDNDFGRGGYAGHQTLCPDDFVCIDGCSK